MLITPGGAVSTYVDNHRLIISDVKYQYWPFARVYWGSMAQTRATRAGRPATGVRPGEKASEYQRLTMRLPDDSLALLKAIGRAVDAPAWRVMVEALRAYMGDAPALSSEQRRAVRQLLRLTS